MGYGWARTVPKLRRGVLQRGRLLHSRLRRQRAQVLRDASDLARRLPQTRTYFKHRVIKLHFNS